MAPQYASKRRFFQILRRIEEGEFAYEKALYRIRIEKGLIFTLSIMIILFNLSRRFPERAPKIMPIVVIAAQNIDLPPKTVQNGIPRPPIRPLIPIPSEEEIILEDEVIDSLWFSFDESFLWSDGIGENEGGVGGIQPHPILEAFPEYPDDIRTKGIGGVIVVSLLVNYEGKVDSVHILENTTQNRILEKAAIAAAYRTQYLPAKKDGKPISMWIQRPYHFQSE